MNSACWKGTDRWQDIPSLVVITIKGLVILAGQVGRLYPPFAFRCVSRLRAEVSGVGSGLVSSISISSQNKFLTVNYLAAGFDALIVMWTAHWLFNVVHFLTASAADFGNVHGITSPSTASDLTLRSGHRADIETLTKCRVKPDLITLR